MQSIDELARALRRPAAYPHQVGEVAFVETHVSLLAFAGERVYKVKKPLDLGFLDFTTLARRRHFCEEEVRLNRRLAPDVYLGVVPIVRDPARGVVVGGEGEPFEWAVAMVRLPEERMLHRLLDRGEIDNERMNELCSLLVAFHRRVPTGAGVDEHGMPDAVARNAEENFAELRPFLRGADPGGSWSLGPELHAFLAARARAFLRENRELLERRVREGRIRDGHGDLHAGNVCFTDGGVVAYDCIEFARRFRCGDVASEIAFLAMDLDFRGYPGFAGYVAHRYATLAGDSELAACLDFYKAYRAVVRGKVASLRAAGLPEGGAERTEARREALRYLQLAACYDLPPALILLCGLPATGKSWVGRELAGPQRAVVQQSDVRRKVLAGLPLRERRHERFESGLYGSEMKERTYRSLLERSVAALEEGRTVIVDATFSKRAYRRPFVDAAARLGRPWLLVHVTAPEEVVRARLEERARDPEAVSDADLDVYLRAREGFEPPDELPAEHVIATVSGAEPLAELGARVVDRRIELQGRATKGA